MTTNPLQPSEPASSELIAAGAVPLAGESLIATVEDDIGDDEEERGPFRRCLVTRDRDRAERMLRFVVGPDRMVVPDFSATLPGRGMWLSARSDVLETALSRRAFARAARAEVRVPDELPALIETMLRRRLVDRLGLARRAGQAVSGFEKAREWLAQGRAALLVQASDGSEDERARLLNGRPVLAIAPLPAEALGQVFGRDRVVHVAVAAGKLAAGLRIDNERLAGFSRREGKGAGPVRHAHGP